TAGTELTPATESPRVAQEPSSEEAEQQRPPLFVPNELQRKWLPKEVQTWFGKVRAGHPRTREESKSAYTRRLHKYMENDFDDPPWDVETLRRRLNDPDYA